MTSFNLCFLAKFTVATMSSVVSAMTAQGLTAETQAPSHPRDCVAPGCSSRKKGFSILLMVLELIELSAPTLLAIRGCTWMSLPCTLSLRFFHSAGVINSRDVFESFE